MVLTQFVFLRSDLKNFGKGSLIVQACHATTFATISFMEHPDTKAYLNDITDMRKVILKIVGANFVEIEKELKKAGVDYVIWTEKPENIDTCLGTRPFDLAASGLEIYFKKFKLF